MQFNDPQLEKHVQAVATSITGLPDDQRMVVGLLDAYDSFVSIEGEQSPRAKEVIEALLSAELRPAVRQLYRSLGKEISLDGLSFRERLSEMAGEPFG